eukprot:CAMPEP_0184306532 /NCGR_PEP_ID=MMETSP1049-20130417/15507_1 /TAXON_ID=77928 /ORGANISM="Proteomonas sulcata, Strain CCMP704" /LENGTH=55 /DNA_ID=CAMNT_0026618821 /DNA_START=385 /DNA_END=552 /DNA_ORIENTATION=-
MAILRFSSSCLADSLPPPPKKRSPNHPILSKVELQRVRELRIRAAELEELRSLRA